MRRLGVREGSIGEEAAKWMAVVERFVPVAKVRIVARIETLRVHADHVQQRRDKDVRIHSPQRPRRVRRLQPSLGRESFWRSRKQVWPDRPYAAVGPNHVGGVGDLIQDHALEQCQHHIEAKPVGAERQRDPSRIPFQRLDAGG
jgi:hypothetical protein